MLRRLAFALLLGVALVVMFVAIGSLFESEGPVVCTRERRFGVGVVVRDAVTGAQAGDGASVTIRDGDHAESATLMTKAFAGQPDGYFLRANERDRERLLDGPLRFSGASERAGTYGVTVTKPGYERWFGTVTVERDDCHVIPEVVQAKLVRSDDGPDYVGAAKRVLAFLRGEGTLDGVALADQVRLVAPISPWSARKISGDSRHQRGEWYVVWRGNRYALTPPARRAELKTREGYHLLCDMPRSLASIGMWRYTTSPHVGTTLVFQPRESCLQTWNLTFVFDAVKEEPTLIAVVYDQWEW